MEISSSYNSYATAQTSKTSLSQSSSNSFDSFLNTQNEETTNNNQTSKLVNFIDKRNGFSSLSPTDEKIFRDILSDGILKNEEMKNLTYEQTKKLSNLINSAYSSIESLSNTPVLGSDIATSFSVINKTDNEDFNKALFETAQSIDNQIERMNFFDRLSNTLGFNDNTNIQKTLYNKTNDPKYLPQDEDWKIIDYSKYINTNINELDSLLKNRNILDEDKLIYKQVLDNFITLQKNYNEIKSEAKYA